MLQEILQQLERLSTKLLANKISVDGKKPQICIVSTQNDCSLTNAHIDNVVSFVSNGIASNGGNCHTVHISTLDSNSLPLSTQAKYSLPSRDLIANEIEVIASNQLFDGFVFVGGDNNATAGMLIGAIRVNKPALFVGCGIMSAINYDGKQCGLFDIMSTIGMLKNNKINKEQFSQIEQTAPLVGGFDCNRYGHASFSCMLEAVGLSVRGSSTVIATSPQQNKLAAEAGSQIVQMVVDNITPRKVLTNNALMNGIMTDLACGGCSTTTLNTIAVAKELGIKTINLRTIDELSRTTPLLLVPAKTSPIMYQLDNAGGIYAVMKQLLVAKLLKNDAIRYDNKEIGSVVESTKVLDANVVVTYNKTTSSSSTLRVLYGNVANGGCMCHYHDNNSFVGKAKVYNNQEAVIDALMHKEIKAGDVVVILNEGVDSGIGMQEIMLPLAIIEGMGLSSKVAVLTDGRISDGYSGIAIGHITPETADNSIFAVLQDGDEIEISIPKGKVNCDIKAKELAQRVKQLYSDGGGFSTTFLRNWSRTTSGPMEGCIAKSKK